MSLMVNTKAPKEMLVLVLAFVFMVAFVMVWAFSHESAQNNVSHDPKNYSEGIQVQPEPSQTLKMMKQTTNTTPADQSSTPLDTSH